MAEEIGTEVNLLGYPPDVHELQHWTGTGQLRWRQDTWECEFVLSRLLNGRLRFLAMPLDWRQSCTFTESRPLEFEGISEDGYQILVNGIHFTRTIHDLFPWNAFLGYAESASRRKGQDAEEVTVRCDLTNYALIQRRGPVNFRIGNFDINLERLKWEREYAIEEHSYAYQHAPVDTYLKIESISSDKVPEALDCLEDVAALLSIACRGHVFIVAQHVYNIEKGKIESEYREPPFPKRRWGQPLIPSPSIEEFLTTVYPGYRSRVERLELSHIIDHYLQALTLRSLWPQLVGIFTAMETLTKAFFRRNAGEKNNSFVYWIVPPEDFASNKDMIAEVIEVLGNHFSKFRKLTRDERQSLEAQIANGLKRRSYKTQLRRMLNLLTVEYEARELQPFIDTRNKLIHGGAGVPADTSLDEYDNETAEALERAKRAVSLFERALLAFLNYGGPRELYDEGLVRH